eukprot:3294114-Rhodomonas_salina.1
MLGTARQKTRTSSLHGSSVTRFSLSCNGPSSTGVTGSSPSSSYPSPLYRASPLYRVTTASRSASANALPPPFSTLSVSLPIASGLPDLDRIVSTIGCRARSTTAAVANSSRALARAVPSQYRSGSSTASAVAVVVLVLVLRARTSGTGVQASEVHSQRLLLVTPQPDLTGTVPRAQRQ